MKQGNKFIKMIMLVLAFMVVSYILYNIIHSMRSGVPTSQAVVFSATESASTEGFLIRQETLLSADFELIFSTKAEGEKVAAGSQVALSLRSTAARERQERIVRLESDIEQLQTALTYQSQLTDSAAVTAKIDETGAAFAAQVASGRLDSAAATGQSMKSLILRKELGTDDTLGLQRQIGKLQEELASQQILAAKDTASVRVDQAGYYSACADGYESILTPESISSISVEEFTGLWESSEGPAKPRRTAGRLIESHEWYYAALVDDTLLEKLHTGQRLDVRFGGEINRLLEMTVSRIERSRDEKGLLVLRCNRSLSDISALRRAKAEVIFKVWNGVRVPKEAVCYDPEDDTAGVYILENGKAVWKSVTLIYDVGDAYIADLDQTSTDNLWPGDLILQQTHGLYDGKVIE